MDKTQSAQDQSPEEPTWQQSVARFQHPDVRRSLWQLANSVLPYFALWVLMVYSLQVSYWLTLLLAIPAAGFLVRTFIIFHDCGHGSFFKSKKANDAVGIFTGLFTFTPYYHWRHNHAVHHATVADLDRRGTGDVMMLTIAEYDKLPGWKRFGYRVMRNPLIMFTIGSLGVFIVSHRFYSRKDGRLERSSVIWTKYLLLLGLLVLISLTITLKVFILIQLPVLFLATSTGVWLFYVQHQFDGVYWERHERWNYMAAALQGSSYYKLPRLLQWFSGNIGFHHVHHVSPRIPNYNLEACHKDCRTFREVRPLTLRSSLKSLSLRLYDEQARRMVGFRSREPCPDMDCDLGLAETCLG